MAEVTPFCAIRYNHERLNGDLSSVLAPPYDVLDQADKNALLAKSDRNIVAIDLPYIPPKSLGPQEVYDRSARMLADWLANGTLVREDEPAIYLYHQVFQHEGHQYIRRMFIARVRLVEFSEGIVLPHEETFGGPKEDRLALTKATRCNMSAVFSLYADPYDAIGEIFDATADSRPDVQAGLDDVKNRLWIITDEQIIDDVCQEMASKQVFIADGHHRYGTALNYREFIRQSEGGLADDHPANQVMMVLGSMNDPGSLILPYNRVLLGADANLAAIVKAWNTGAEPAEESPDLLLFEGTSKKEQPLRFTNRPKLAQLEPDHSPAWHQLDYAYLHRFLIEDLAKGLEVSVQYVKSAADARELATREHGVAILTKATPMDHLRAVSASGELMPQKSTYFHPKLATGLTINPLS
jgi:uncharacterized protein (DUF1015 family)